MDKYILLESLPAFFDGVDFKNKNAMMSKTLDHVGLIIKKTERSYGGVKNVKKFITPINHPVNPNMVAVDIKFKEVFGEIKQDDNGKDYLFTRDLQQNEKPNYEEHLKSYYYSDGTVYCSMTEHKEIQNIKEYEKSKAKHALNYLVNTAEALGVQAVGALNFIFDSYKLEIDKWLTLGNESFFLNKLLNEDRSSVLGVINTAIPNYEPKTFKDAIEEQLTEVKWLNN